MATEVETSHIQITDNSGDPVSGAKVYIYDIGTTTLKDVFSDPDLDVSHAAANPIVTDSAGRHPIRYIATGSYKYWVKTSAGVSLYDAIDNVDGRVPVGSGALAIANGGTGATSAAAALTALGGATSAEMADLSAEVAAIAGTIASTEKTHLATGTTAQRPASPVAGDVRRNTTTNRYEGYNQSAAFEQFFTDTEIASAAEALAGSDNTKVMTPARSRTANAFQSSLLHVRDEKAAGTDGGTLTSGSFQTRVLNTSVTNEISGASLGSNQMTLPAGTYFIEASAPSAGNIGLNVAKLRNTTDSTDLLIGHGGKWASGDMSRIRVNGRFTLAAQKVLELQHRGATTQTTTGLGIAVNLGVTEVYADVMIWKVA